MFMNQITRLIILDYGSKKVQNIIFIGLPQTKECLKNLSELRCSSEIYPEFFYKVSQICDNIRTLTIIIEKSISDGLENLVFSRKNLKHLKLIQTSDTNWTEIIPALTKHHSTLTKL